MLSIRFSEGREWWTSAADFERLYQSALGQGALAPELEEWRHVAEANGGLSLDSLDAVTARQLALGLRQAAQEDLARLPEILPQSSETSDARYGASLRDLLRVTTSAD
jgi:hypothetical protein